MEWNTGLYLVFVDFEKAFDSADLEVIWMILWHCRIPEKIVREIQGSGLQARVLYDGDRKEPLSMSTGIRQGCLFSPLLFVMALDWVSCQAFGDNETGIQVSLLWKLEDLDFAVDMVLLSQKIAHMRQKFEALQEQLPELGSM